MGFQFLTKQIWFQKIQFFKDYCTSNLKNEKKRYIFEKFNNENIFSVPLIKNTEDARSSIEKIKPFKIEDLFGREQDPQ